MSETFTLPDIARQTGRQYEASPTGRWVRFDGSSEAPIYVVRMPWSDGCLVLGTPGREEGPERYLDAKAAVLAAVQQVDEQIRLGASRRSHDGRA